MIRPSLRRGPAAPRSSKDDTGPGYYDTLAGDIWRPAPSRAAGPRRRAPTARRPFGHRPPQRALSQNSRPEQDYQQTWRTT
jgi:hypothetical protein